MACVVRFAPSPTGYLHVGNVRTALVNHLFARKEGGTFILRIDDTDTERSKAEYETAIVEDLAWLGIQVDTTEKQSLRFDRYHLAIETLKAGGRLYPCFETAEELEVKRKMQSGRGLPPIYDRAALKLSDAEKQALMASGKKMHWRFLLNETDVVWNDLIREEVRFKPTHMSDPILIREDGVPVYTLASVVDDGEMSVTHVIRGEDHVSNTAVQVQLYEALGFSVPTFAHMALLKTKEGELSKRLGSGSIRDLKAQGIVPQAIVCLLARIGTSDSVEAFVTDAPLIESFDFKKFGRSPANYDVVELVNLNAKILHDLPFAAVKSELPYADEAFWLSVRENLSTLADAKGWWDILRGDITASLSAEDAVFVKESAKLLPEEPWNISTWDAWIAAIKPSTERKGKTLFMPLRMALTGMEHGPELKTLLPLLGRVKALQRLGA